MSQMHEDQAVGWLQKAEKKLNSFSMPWSTSTKYEDAAEMYQKAANLFKLAKKFKEAGDTFQKVAECHLKLQSAHEAATAYVDAANSYKKSSVPDAIMCLNQAITIYLDGGRFSQAAKYHKEIAELHEGENDLESAITNFSTAADLYQGEESHSSANGCLLKVAQLSATLEQYQRAFEIYEQIAANSLDNTLLKWSVKEYFLRAGLCKLAGEPEKAREAIMKFQDMDITFRETREGEFLNKLLDTVEEYDVEEYTNVVKDFDTISPFDAWKTKLLLHIKNNIKKAQPDLT